MSSAPHERFSLLLLEDGELLLDDVAVDYEFLPAAAGPPPATLPPQAARLHADRARARGRLKLATRSLLFDPDDLREPVVRVPLAATRPARVREARPPADEPPAPPDGVRAKEVMVVAAGNSVAASAAAAGEELRRPWPARLLGGLVFGLLAAVGAGGGEDRVEGGGDDDGAVPAAGDCERERERQGGVAAEMARADSVVVVAPHVEAGRRVSMRLLQPWRRGDGAAEDQPDGGGEGCGGERQCLVVRASRAVFQREGGADHAYVDSALDGAHCFTPLYSGADTLLELVSWLQRVAALPGRRERERALREAVRAREEKVPFDIAWLEGGVREETVFDRPCAAVSALSRAPGRARITTTGIYLMPIHGGSGGIMTRVPVKQLVSVRRMRHGLRDSALEIGYEPGEGECRVGTVGGVGGVGGRSRERRMTMMLAFKSRRVRDEAVELLSAQVAPRKLQAFDRAELDLAQTRWRAGELSNFDYLLFLNLTAGRSFNDLSQYPVFPWVLADYTSAELDFYAPATFRDLSLPIGALEPSRRAFFEERYREMSAPRFHFGTHYSTPAYVINFLVRVVPGAMLRLQNGKFDSADRLFNSIADAWSSVANSTTDVKELIPEFYAVHACETPSGIVSASSQPSDFLENIQCLDLGVRQDGRRVEDVELPRWANGSADEFLAKHRLALESVYVSSHIHLWIDLIFGVKARNAGACNVFYTDVALQDALVGLDDADDGEDGRDPEAVTQLETVLLEFGRTPEQLFLHHHPPRFGSLVADPVGSSDEILLSPEVFVPSMCSNNANEARSGDEAESNNGDSSESDCGADTHVLSSVRSGQQVGDVVADDSDTGSVDVDCVTANDDDDVVVKSYVSRTYSTMSVSERRLSITLAPSCSFLSQFADEADRRHVVPRLLQRQSPGSRVGIVDFAVAYVSLGRRQQLQLTAVTAWSDGQLRIFVDSKLHRSRHVVGLTSIASGDDAKVFLGTSEGSLLLYSISSGRSEVLLSNAHAAGVTAICYSRESSFLVTGSVDATVQVWRMDSQCHVLAMMRRFQELDAEDAVASVAIDVQGSCLYVACITEVGRVLAWRLDLADDRESVDESCPIFDLESTSSGIAVPRVRLSDSSTAVRRELLCWLKPSRHKLMLAVLQDGAESCVRLWDIGDARMPAAKIILPGARPASCISRGDGNGTLLVGCDGRVAEYDRTGLLLRQVAVDEAAGGEVTGICVNAEAGMLSARIGTEDIVTWSGCARAS